MTETEALFEYLLRLGDDALILGHRLSEWCGHAPILEEDIALANLALDCIGHASLILKLAGKVEGKGRSDDDLAYLRDEVEFRNLKLVEQPNGDFAKTIARQFLIDAFRVVLFEELQKSKNAELAAIASKIIKEVRYHLRHSSQWVLRLGDGTAESRSRMERALGELWTFTAELFEEDPVVKTLEKSMIAPSMNSIRPNWEKLVESTLKQATLSMPDSKQYMASGGRKGLHTEHLGHLLAEMQILQRSHPGASW